VLQAAHRDGDVVNGAKAFAMVRKRMVKSAAEVEPTPSESACRAARVVPPAARQNASTICGE